MSFGALNLIEINCFLGSREENCKCCQTDWLASWAKFGLERGLAGGALGGNREVQG